MDTVAFVRANSTNLPRVDMFMIIEFMKTSDKHNVAEIRGVKALMSSRESYLETAVGYAEVKRCGNECIVRCKVVPEHRIAQKFYVVSVHLLETVDTVKDTSCDGCAASAGGCKHTLLLLFWLEKRSAEPSPTSVQCYWQMPKLVTARQKHVESKNIYKNKKTTKIEAKNKSVLEKFQDECSKHECGSSLITCFDGRDKPTNLLKFCIFDLLIEFTQKERDHSYENFTLFCNGKLNEDVKKEIADKTTAQASSKLWHCMRQGRITASKLYEVAHCRTPSGSLVEELLGGYKLVETKAMKRGKNLEKQVFRKIEQKLKLKIGETGFCLVNGIIGASPDGICNEFVLEIKCPNSEKTKYNYLKDYTVADKYMAQIQLEMLATGKKRGLFCVADPKFEQNQKIDTVWVDFDSVFLNDLIAKAELFWKTNVFPEILKSVYI